MALGESVGSGVCLWSVGLRSDLRPDFYAVILNSLELLDGMKPHLTRGSWSLSRD